MFGCIDSNNKPNKTDEKKEFRDYDFTIWIKLNNQNKDFDYIINRKYYSFNEKKNFEFHDDMLLEQIISDQQISIDNKVKVIPADTIKHRLNKQQLDTLYLLTAKLFNADTLNYVCDKTRKGCNYDGKYPEVTFTNRNANYKILFTYLSDKKIVESFEKLLAYIDRLKNSKEKKYNK